MKFIAGGLNNQFLIDFANKAARYSKIIYAAVAYASSDPYLFQICRNHEIRLKFYGRYDISAPIATPILKKFLDVKSPNYECKLVPDIFHPKVIWWKDYGAYIGSANLTERGWFNNIEAGVIFDGFDIIENDMTEELESFFEEVDDRSFPLTVEIYNELLKLEKEKNRQKAGQKANEDRFRKNRKIPPIDPLIRRVKKSSVERRRNNFIIEWNETLQLLRNISERVSQDEFRPDWVDRQVPKGVQVDQFLHAFYYSEVRKGSTALHHEFHEENVDNPERALKSAMLWWKLLEEAPHTEHETIYDWAPYLKRKLSSDIILTLNQSEFTDVCSKIHAMRDHSLRVKYTEFGLDRPLPQMESDQRIKYFSEWLYNQKSKSGRSVLETINFVLYGGDTAQLSNRLWESVENDEWFIPHLGVSSFGEITGWAMPDIFPPRNGRTSKALFALGNKVRIHSE